MQDRYAGDVGDFGKFGLLRHLCRETAQDKLKPGVIWYKTTPGKKEKETPHKNFIRYLGESDENDRRLGRVTRNFMKRLDMS